jgi:hypothetical protein
VWGAECELLGQRLGKAIGTAVVVLSRGGLEIAHGSSMLSFSFPRLWLYRAQHCMRVTTGIIYRSIRAGKDRRVRVL